MSFFEHFTHWIMQLVIITPLHHLISNYCYECRCYNLKVWKNSLYGARWGASPFGSVKKSLKSGLNGVQLTPTIHRLSRCTMYNLRLSYKFLQKSLHYSRPPASSRSTSDRRATTMEVVAEMEVVVVAKAVAVVSSNS